MSEEARQWMMMGLDPNMARRQGMPLTVPVPKEEFDSLADTGLTVEKLEGWIKSFLETSDLAKDGNWRRRNSELVYGLESYIDKQPVWKKAQDAFAKNDYEAAKKALKRVTILAPDDHSAKMNYASALANTSEYKKALKLMKQIRESYDGQADYHVNYAQMLVATDEPDKAIEQLLKALESQPDHLPAMDALSKLGLLTRMYENPRDAQSLVYVRTDDVVTYITGHWDSEERDVAYLLEQMGYHENERRYPIALEAAERALKADANSERAQQGKVAALIGMGNVDGALEAASAYVSAAPDSAAAHVELSKCLSKAGKRDEAKAEIDKALECNPGDQEAIVLKLWPDDRGDLMKVQEALPGIQAHAEAHPDVPGVWRSVARALVVVGNDDEALATFKKAVDLTADDEDLRSEWWAELAAKRRFDDIIRDAEAIGDMPDRDWRLRWNEAEAYRGLGKQMEARACYTAINNDEQLHVDIRKRAKRAVMEMGGGGGATPGEDGAETPAGG